MILNCEDYINEADRQLSQKQHYRETDYNLTTTFTNKIKANITKMATNDKLPQECLKTLIPNNVRTSPFYMLPKIHKENHPGRPIVSGIDSPTDLISQTMDRILKPLVPKTQSYLKDTKHFLNIIKDIGYLHEDEYLVTIDVGSLYTSIPHSEGIEAATQALISSRNPSIEPDTARKLLKLILEHNTFTFNGKFYHQLQCTAMGTKVAPTYANLFMDHLERKLLREMPLKPTIWKRFIDDIFTIFKCTEDELRENLEWMNSQHNTIKFTYEYSRETINYLDTTTYVDEHRKLQTKVYKKPTDTDMYLHYKSYHPRHQKKNSICYSQAARYRLICSELRNFDIICQRLLKQMTLRGHPHSRLKTEIARARALDREQLLKTQHTGDKKIIPFIIQYNPANIRSKKIVRTARNSIQKRPDTAKLRENDILTAYKRAPNLRDLLTSSHESRTRTKHQSKPCMILSCNQCENINRTTYIISKVTGKRHQIIGNNNCQSRSVIYALNCPACKQQYIGETVMDPLPTRIQEHKRDISTRNRNSPVAVHFLDHDINPQDLRHTIINNSAQNKNQRLRLEEAWIRIMQTTTPHGINRKL